MALVRGFGLGMGALLAAVSVAGCVGGTIDEWDVQDKETAPPDVGAFCGDGDVQSFEECDPAADGGESTASCLDLGYEAEGVAPCGDDCTWDLSACPGSVCGNGYLDEGEECDPGYTQTECPYGVESCEVCGADCTIVPGVPIGWCGDGEIFDGLEECGEPGLPDPDPPCDDGSIPCVDCRVDYRVCDGTEFDVGIPDDAGSVEDDAGTEDDASTGGDAGASEDDAATEDDAGTQDDDGASRTEDEDGCAAAGAASGTPVAAALGLLALCMTRRRRRRTLRAR